MLRRLFAVLTSILLIWSTPALAQDQGGVEEITDGTEYYFGIPHCLIENGEAARGEPVQLFVSSKVNTLVTVEGPGLGFKVSKTVPANKVISVALPESFMNKTSEEIKQLGLHVTAPDPISLTVFLSYRWSGEAYRVIPVDWLGRKYYTLNLYQDKTDNLKPSQILIIGTEDKTVVSYIPTAETEGGVGIGRKKEITINKGETFLIKGMTREALTFVGGDLSGTVIESDKPIGVLAGHTKGAFPNYNATMLGRPANFMRNMYMEMMWPVELLGTEYISAPLKYMSRTKNIDPNDAGDLIRFVATVDNTQIYQMRQDGAGAKLICLRIDKGEYFDIPNQELAAHYKATKPVLVGHYGKAWRDHVVNGIDKGENPQNPARNGMGMMLVLTPIDRWTKSAVFRSSEHTDDFVYITYYAEDEAGLKFDGKPFRSIFLGSLKTIAGTQFKYVAQQISAGDHNIEGGRFAAYAYGNYDYSKDGYAYGYPTGINFASPCPDSLAIEDKNLCGDVDGVAKALPDNSTCAGIFSVRVIGDAENYNFELSPKFRSGDKRAPFTLKIIDMRKPATAVVRALTRSGKFLTRTYHYEPEQLTIAPTAYNFKTVAVGEKLCTNFTLTNPGTVPTTIQSVRFKLNRQEFSITNAKDFPITLQPKESKVIEVCGTGMAPGVNVYDSVMAQLSCYPELARVEIKTDEPLVHIADADFGQVPVNQLRRKDVLIRNVSNVKVILTSMSWPDADKNHFPKVENLTFPLELNAGETHTFQTYYNPLNEINVQHSTRALFVGNTTKVKLYSDWTGSGMEAGPYISKFDWKERRVLDNFVDANTKTNGYAATIEYGSTGNTALQNVKLTVSGPDGAYFVVPTGDVAFTLNPNEPHTLNVAFKPEWVVGTRNGERPYNVTLTLTGTDNGVEKTATGELLGVGVQPHIDMLPQIDFGTILVNSTKPDKSWVKSTGTMDLTLDNKITGLRIEGADKAFFEIDPSFSIQYPNAVAINGQVEVPIIFKPNQVRSYQAELVVESDAPETPKTILIGKAFQDKTPSVIATDHNFGKVYIKIAPKAGQVSITNNGEVRGTVKSMTLVGNDPDRFNIITQAGFPIEIGQPVPIDVNFTANEVRQYTAQIEYDVEWEGGAFPNTKVYSNLIGEGDAIVSVVKIRDDYRAKPGQRDIPIDFELTDANLDPADVDWFHAKVRYNPVVAEPVMGVENIITAGTMTNGWTVLYAGTTSVPGELYVDMKNENGKGVNLKGAGVLFKFKMNAYLSAEHKTALPCEMEPVGKPFVTMKNIPGLLTIEEVCADNIRSVAGSGIKYGLMTSTPNPTKGQTKVEYSIGLEATTTLAVYNDLGQRIATLVNQKQAPGTYEVTFDIATLGLPSGTYTYRLESGPYSDVQTLTITK